MAFFHDINETDEEDDEDEDEEEEEPEHNGSVASMEGTPALPAPPPTGAMSCFSSEESAVPVHQARGANAPHTGSTGLHGRLSTSA